MSGIKNSPEQITASKKRRLEILSIRWTKFHRENPPETRFWKNVDKRTENECWNWTGCVDGAGYGMISINFQRKKSHRMAWEIAHGPITDGLWVCHHCDNPRCCNPKHLFLGTYYDNMNDAIAKGRQPVVKGSKHFNAKLKEQDIIKIRQESKNGAKQRFLANKYGVGQDHISRIINFQAWGHVMARI